MTYPDICVRHILQECRGIGVPTLDHPKHTTRPEPTCAGCLETFQRTIIAWSAGSGQPFPWRRPDRRTYELVVAEVLLQQTRAEHVAGSFDAIIDRCPDWPDLAKIPIADLENLLKPLGLQRRRAGALHALAKAVIQKGMPKTASELEQLPGIGQYIARAIATQLFQEVVAPIDTNVARILERVFGPRTLADIRYDPELQRLALNLVPPTDPGGYLVALLDFAAIVCRPRTPRCEDCPVSICRFRTENHHLSS